MADTILDKALALRADDRFRGWVQIMICNVARIIYAEPTATPGHPARVELALRIVLNPEEYVQRMINILTGDPDIVSRIAGKDDLGGDSTVAFLQAKVAALWTAIALAENPGA